MIMKKLFRKFGLVCAVTAMLVGLGTASPTSLFTEVHANASITSEQLFTTALADLQWMQANGGSNPYNTFGSCTGGLAHMLAAVDAKYGTSLGSQIEEKREGIDTYAHWNTQQVKANLDTMVANGQATFIGSFNSDAELNASGAKSGDIFSMNDTGNESTSGHVGIIYAENGTVQTMNVSADSTFVHNASVFVPSKCTWPISVYRVTTDNKTLTINLHKSSDNPDMTSNNKQYSLAGAVYGVYTDQACSNEIARITTDTSGNGSASYTCNPDVSALYVKEIQASNGFCLDESVHTVTFEGSSSLSKDCNVVEEAGNDPVLITINKVAKDVTGDNIPSMIGTEFTVKYYDEQFTSVDQIGSTAPKKTWVINVSQTSGGNYYARLDDAHKVGGDEYYRATDGSNAVIVPVGTITIQETKAASGYEIANAEMTVLNGDETITLSSDETALFNCVPDQKGRYGVKTGNNYTLSESSKPQAHEINIQKCDDDFYIFTSGDSDNLTTSIRIKNKNSYGVILRDGKENEVARAEANDYFKTSNGGDYLITTDTDGYWTSGTEGLNFPVGTYAFEEVTAPVGYRLLEGAFAEITVTGNERRDISLDEGQLTNDQIHGGFSIQKFDDLTGTDAEGDTNLQTTFMITNKSKYFVCIDGEVYEPDDVIGVFTTDQNGFYQSATDYLPYGTYQIDEVVSPVGYTGTSEPNNKLTQTFTIREEGKIVALTSMSQGLINRPYLDHFTIHKTYSEGSDSTTSSMVKNEANAEFTALLKSKVNDINGDGTISISEARQQANDLSGFTSREYAVVTTDKNGNASSNELAYGTYILFQTKTGNKELKMIESITEFTIKEDNHNGETKAEFEFEATNQAQPYTLKIYKIDADTGKKVSYTSSAWKIKMLKDANGNAVQKDTDLTKYSRIDSDGYVVQRIGDIFKTEYDVFMSASDEDPDREDGVFYGSSNGRDDNEGGLSTVPLELYAGTYQLEEVITAEGFVTTKTIEFTINADSITSTNEANQKFIEINYENKRLTGSVNFVKTINKWEEKDTTLLDYDLTKFGFTLYAAEDIIDPDDGSVLVSKGQEAVTLTHDTTSPYITIGEVHPDADGKFSITDLPLGNYVLKETTWPDGYVTPEKEYTIEVKQTKFDKQIKDIAYIGEPPKVLPGYSEWIDRFVMESDVSVKVDGKKSKLHTITNDVTKTSFSKKTFTGEEELEGASLQVTDQDGNIIDEWVSTSEEHKIEGLTVGKTYTLTETIAPEGYVRASSIEFTIKDTSEVQTQEMIDYVVDMTKTDVATEELECASMKVYNSKNEVVDEWTSTTEAHRINNLDEGQTYTLVEDTAPLGYVKASSMTFVAGRKADGSKGDLSITMVDKIVDMTKVDVSGEEVPGAQITVYAEDDTERTTPIDQWTSTTEPHRINNLEEGKTYIMSETIQAEGYVKASDIKFVALGADKNGNKTDQHIDMVDKIVSMTKADIASSSVEGAEMQVLDENGIVKDEWISASEEHRINNLEVGNTYILREKKAPEGYVRAKDIKFEVPDDETDQSLTMTDYQVKAIKVDADKKALEGATLTVVDSQNNVKDTWVSTTEAHAISNLDEGTTYYLQETVTPEGYATAKDIEFVAGLDDEGNPNDLEITMIDKKVTLSKNDGMGEEVPGAHIVVKDKDGNTVDEWDSTDTPHEINGLKVGETYTMEETQAPDGYYYAETGTFTVTDDGLDQFEEMIDNPIRYSIAKVDDKGNYVQGVTLTLTDITDEDNPVSVTLPNEGVTTGEPFVLDKVLIAEHTYELVESEYVEGLYKATSMQFTVPKYGTSDVTTITMEDTLTNISITKIDNHGNLVKGAELTVYKAVKNEDGTVTVALDEEGHEIEASTVDGTKAVFTTDGETKYIDISDYVKGSNEESGDVYYILRETKTPFGFETMDDVVFTVTGTNDQHQIITGTDVRKTYYVSALKVDSKDHKKLLKGAEITLFTKDGTVAKGTNGKDCIGTTDGNGSIIFNVEFNGDTSGYYFQETKAPEGYQLNSEKYEITLKESYDFANNNPIKITIENEAIKIPDTSDHSYAIVWLVIGFIALVDIAAIGTYRIKRKKSIDDE